MTEAVRTEAGSSRLSALWSAWNDPAVRLRNVDWLAGLIAVLLPWSTTGVGIAAVLWLIALVPTIEPKALWQSLKRPVSALPLAFVALVVIGLLWSDAPWHDKSHQLGQASKLLLLPLLIYHFERSSRGLWVFVAFLVSCLLVAIASVVAIDPALSLKQLFSTRGSFTPTAGVAVRNYIDQGQEFSLCAVALAYPAVTSLRDGRTGRGLLLAAIALALVANLFFVVTSRTALVTMPIMLAIFLLLHVRWQIAIAALCALALLAGGAWLTSSHMRITVNKFFVDYQGTSVQNNETGMGSRLIYWGKSLKFFADAPVLGHGTGSTRTEFEKVRGDGVGARGMVVSDPHNQTLNVAIQWGALGVILLWAMWIAHLLLFRGEGLASWIGFLVVIQNVLTSVLNSHLFDFTEGWIYVLGVGIAGGMALAEKVSPRAAAPGGSVSA
jgi:O-antigen ligase